MNVPWRIELFGGLQLFGDHGVVVSRFQTRKTGALLGYLAYYKEKPVSRDLLADLFWPENDPEAARNSLRVALNSLRRQLEPPPIPPGGVLSADRAAVVLKSQAVTTDVGEFERALKTERSADDADFATRTACLLQAVELYKGPLLSGWYEEWIDLEQTRLAEVYAGALRRLTSLLFKCEDYDRALEFAQRAVQSDPLREENHRHLMRLYASLGRPDAALKAFRILETTLRNQMNAVPSGVTRDLVKQIAAQSAGAAVVSSESTCESVTDSPVVEPVQVALLETTAALVPMPAISENRVGSLPRQWTRFWGRDTELTRLHDLLMPDTQNPARLVTLIGPGGVGKTRLAVEAAARLRQTTFGGGVWFVSLDETSPNETMPTIHESVTCDTEEAYETSIVASLSRALRLQSPIPSDITGTTEHIIGALFRTMDHLAGGAFEPVLLILDGVGSTENMSRAVARVAKRLMECAPDGLLRCLVTARRRLDIAFERTFFVEPLPVPPIAWQSADFFKGTESGAVEGVGSSVAASQPAPAHLVDALATYPSVALFVERAQAVRPDFQITPRNALAIADLCVRFDGLPLALELAASWTRLLTPAQMVERTRENAFALLMTERRDLSLRHRSLHTVLTDATRDLSAHLRTFLCVLSVFDGGWTLQAAQMIFADVLDGSSRNVSPKMEHLEAAPDVLSLLDALQSRSLVSAQETEHGLRFRLLQTTRAFAQSLAPKTIIEQARYAHASYYAALSQTAEPFLSGTNAEAWRVPLDGEQDNFRSLLRAACAPDAEWEAVARGLASASALWRWWYARGKSEEGRRTLETLLAQPAAAQTSFCLRSRACHGAGRLALNQNHAARASALFAQSARLFEQGQSAEDAAAGSPRITRTIIATDQVIAARAQGDADTALVALETLLQEKRRSGDAWGTANALTEWGSEQLKRGDNVAAERAFAQSSHLRRAMGDRWGATEADLSHAQALALCGESACAEAVRADAEREQAALGDVQSIAASFLNLGYIASEQGDWETAQPLLRDAVSLYQTEKDREASALVLWLIARCAADHQEIGLALSAAENTLSELPSNGEAAQDFFSSAAAAGPDAPEGMGTARAPASRQTSCCAHSQVKEEFVGETRVFVLANQLLQHIVWGSSGVSHHESYL